MIRLLPGLLILILWIYCLVDVIGAREDGVRHLAKTWWVLIVLFFPLAGSIAWLVAGRPTPERPLTRDQGAAPDFPEYERRGRFAAADPAKDEEFLRKLRERADEQRRRHDEQRRQHDEKRDEGERAP